MIRNKITLVAAAVLAVSSGSLLAQTSNTAKSDTSTRAGQTVRPAQAPR